jgi:hypothetical protein
MLSRALRLLLFRFLPRRVLPILTAIEIVRLIQRLRRRGPEPVAPRRLVTVDGSDRPETAAEAAEWRAGWDSNPRPKD